MRTNTMRYKNMNLKAYVLGQYQDGSMCIELQDDKGNYAMCISFCAPDGEGIFPADENCIWLKDWSENKEIASFLLEEGYVELTGKEIPQQFVTYKEVRITDKLRDIIVYE